MPHRKPYTSEQKARILAFAKDALEEGVGIHRIAKTKKVDVRTLRGWLQEKKRFAELSPQKRAALRRKIERKANEAMRTAGKALQMEITKEVLHLSRREAAAFAIAQGLYANPRYVPVWVRILNVFTYVFMKKATAVYSLHDAAVQAADLLLAELDRTSK